MTVRHCCIFGVQNACLTICYVFTICFIIQMSNKFFFNSYKTKLYRLQTWIRYWEDYFRVIKNINTQIFEWLAYYKILSKLCRNKLYNTVFRAQSYQHQITEKLFWPEFRGNIRLEKISVFNFMSLLLQPKYISSQKIKFSSVLNVNRIEVR